MEDKWKPGFEFSPDRVFHDWDDEPKTEPDALVSFDRPTPRVAFQCTCGGPVGLTVAGALMPSSRPFACVRERNGAWAYCKSKDTVTLSRWAWDA